MSTWWGSMTTAMAATLARPTWWVMALAAFLVRGGIVPVALAIVVIPSPAALATTLSPLIQAIAFGGVTPVRAVAAVAVVVAAVGIVLVAGVLGARLDLAQLREACDDEDLDLTADMRHGTVGRALAVRLIAHLPTVVAAVYATFRLVAAAYDELLAPADTATAIAVRVALRAPDALLVLGVTWLLGETIGGLAARRSATGAGVRPSLVAAIRLLVRPRGLATLGLTTLALAAALVPFLLAAGRAVDQLRFVLARTSDAVTAATALLVLAAVWVLGLAVLGAVLAWRGAAWTAEAAATAPGSTSAAIGETATHEAPGSFPG